MKAKLRPEDIARLLRRAIREREFAPGDPLNQDELAKRFGVSRIPLREALRTLAGEGLVVIRPNLGAVVTELDPVEVTELYDLRLQIEPPLAPDIVARCRPEDLAELRKVLEAMDEVADSDLDRWANLHYVFHRRLDELSGRKHSLRLVVQVLNLIEPYTRYAAQLQGVHVHRATEHEGVLAAIEDRDPERLAALMTNALANSRAELLAVMAEESPASDPIEALLEER